MWLIDAWETAPSEHDVERREWGWTNLGVTFDTKEEAERMVNRMVRLGVWHRMRVREVKP